MKKWKTKKVDGNSKPESHESEIIIPEPKRTYADSESDHYNDWYRQSLPIHSTKYTGKHFKHEVQQCLSLFLLITLLNGI
jgi:hypothetical protein